MCKIKITQDRYTIVDEDVFEWLSWYNWCTSTVCGRSYVSRVVMLGSEGINIRVYIHRLIVGLPSVYRIHWRSGNTLDNRRCNLVVKKKGVLVDCNYSRAFSKNENVKWNKYYGLWESTIYNLRIGLYSNEYDAVQAYENKKEEIDAKITR